MNTIRPLCTVLASSLLLACGEPAGSDMAAVGTSAPTASTPATTAAPSASTAAPPVGTDAPPGAMVITATETNNYSFASTLTIDMIQVKPGTDLTFDWSAVDKDFIGHTVAPEDVDMVALAMWRLTAAELEVKLNNDDLKQVDLVGIVVTYPEETGANTASLLQMTSFGEPLDQSILLGYVNIAEYDPALHTYTLIASTGIKAGDGTRMIQGFQLSAESENTSVTMTSDSTALQYTVDIQSAMPTVVPAGSAAIDVDWTNMTTTSLNTEFLPSQVTDVLVAKYTQSVAELEASFLDLELIADQMYRAEVPAGTSLSLSNLAAADGTPFTGITTDGTWIIALFCGSCANPAPWYLSVLQAQ